MATIKNKVRGSVEVSEDTIKVHDLPCDRVGFKVLLDDGTEVGFFWVEKSVFTGAYTVNRWSDMVGRVVLQAGLTRNEAIEMADALAADRLRRVQ